MSTNTSSADYGRFDELAEEFAARYRRGERPSLQEYIDRCPDLADEIREMFPALVAVEQAEQEQHDRTGPAAAPTNETVTPPLTQVGDYRILREVGRGGMGVVYEAEQVSLGRRVALKVLPRNVSQDPRTLARFRREARSAAQLHHTNIVPVFEVGKDGEVSYYAMQFIQGQGLDLVIEELRRLKDRSHTPGIDRNAESEPRESPVAATATSPALSGSRPVSFMAQALLTGRFVAETVGGTLETQGSNAGREATSACSFHLDSKATVAPPASEPCAVAEASPPSSSVLPGGSGFSPHESGRRAFFRSVAHIGRQVAAGLAFAHARGIIHRDVKPSNLLLDTEGVVWIADFGLAKASDEGLTQTGDILGTIRYMAPERFRGGGDRRVDVYALGLTLYELLTLKPAFDSPDRLELIEQIKTEDPQRPRTLDSRIPRDLETIVLKAIEKDPKGRYPTADALAEDLRRFLDDEPILARRATLTEKYVRWAHRNPVIAILGAALMGVLVLATAASLLVASQMSHLAGQQAMAARSERDTRIVAENDRRLADKARSEADLQRERAEANFQRALATVDQYFTQVSEDQLLTVPGLQPLRRDLLKSALVFYEDYLKTRSQDPVLQSALAAVHLKAARIHLELGQPAQAEADYRNALALYEALSKAALPELQFQNGLAESDLGLGQHAAAREQRRNYLLRSVNVREKLVAVQPADTRIREDMARSYQALGEQELTDKQVREALRAFLKARDIEASLVRDHPDHSGYQHHFAENLGQIAECLCTLGRHQDETIIRPLAIEHARAAYEQAPQVVAHGRLYGALCTREGSNLRSQNRLVEGERAFRQAISIERALIRGRH
jgi:serine/threonine protein kinase